MWRAALFAQVICLAAGAAFGDQATRFGWGDYRMGAAFEDPTTRYAHGILGDAVEYGTLVVELEHKSARVWLPEDRVFEDILPRVVDIGGKPGPEIIVVETDVKLGAQLAVYHAVFPSMIGAPRLRKVAETPHIGQTHRWLAPAGVADFDGDGQNDIAYVETPHLGKVLRIVTLRKGELVEIASAAGFTNHRIGEDFISGGVRNCGDGPELVLADATWSNVVAVRYVSGALTSYVIGDFSGQESFDAAFDC